MSTQMSAAQAAQQNNRGPGGQYSFGTHAESSGVGLAPPQASTEFVRGILEQSYPQSFVEQNLEAITEEVNQGANFERGRINDISGARFEQAHGFTIEEYTLALALADQSSRPALLRKVVQGSVERQSGAATPTYPRTDSRSDFIQGGGISDRVDVEGYGTFHRRSESTAPNEPYAMRFQANRKLTPADVEKFAQLVGYTYRATVRGESMGEPYQDTPYSICVSADTTKSRSDDVGAALGRFEDKLPEMINSGSNLRTTNQAGPGTQGTRLIDGFNEPGLKFETYYDDVATFGRSV